MVTTPVVNWISLSLIVPSKHQARKTFDEQGIKGLAESMRQQRLINPVVVRKVGDRYELISGERRVRAANLLKWESIEAKVIKTVSEAEASVKGLIENLQREDLNPIEEAEGIKELLEMKDSHWTQKRIGEITGKGQTHVSEALRLLTLPKPVQESIRQRILSGTHGVELLRIRNAKSKIEMAQRIAEEGWSVKQTRAAITRFLEPMPTREEMRQATPDPLSELWPPLIKKGFEAGRPWGVHVGSQRVDGKNSISLSAWHFWVAFVAEKPKRHLKQWFLEMAEAMGDGSDENLTDKSAGWTPPADASGKDPIEEAWKNARLPKNEQEQSELEALAAQGPGPVYAWVYGADSFYAKKAAASTWKDMGAASPIEGTRKLVNGLRGFQYKASGKAARDWAEVLADAESKN